MSTCMARIMATLKHIPEIKRTNHSMDLIITMTTTPRTAMNTKKIWTMTSVLEEALIPR